MALDGMYWSNSFIVIRVRCKDRVVPSSCHLLEDFSWSSCLNMKLPAYIYYIYFKNTGLPVG